MGHLKLDGEQTDTGVMSGVRKDKADVRESMSHRTDLGMEGRSAKEDTTAGSASDGTDMEPMTPGGMVDCVKRRTGRHSNRDGLNTA